MNTGRALLESLEPRRLMSATCAEELAAEPSDAGGAEVARRRNQVTLHSFDISRPGGSTPTQQIWDSNTTQTRQVTVIAEM